MQKNDHHRATRLAPLLPLLWFPLAGIAEDDAKTQSPARTIEVIATTPLPALGTDVDKVPANVQSLTVEDVEEQNPLDLSELLFENIGSVNINAAQNNPFQNDLEYRGFLALPLVGSAIGLSVYLDGVRINEGFGDTINWDLIPQSALSSVDLIPGSNWYPTFNALDEDGWRDESPSEIRQLFGKIGWEDEKTDVDLGYIFADNVLTGNAFAPESLLACERDAVYTFPDDTDNRLHFLNLRASHAFTDGLLLVGNAYYLVGFIATASLDKDRWVCKPSR